jgi:hypothetical protein
MLLVLLLRFLVVLQEGGGTEALVGGVCWLLLLQLHTQAKALQILLAQGPACTQFSQFYQNKG